MQIQIAQKIISLSFDTNSILQLNINKKKSFVIVFIAIAILIDEKKFVRVVVLKSLFDQMFQILLKTFNDMFEKRIFQLSISRLIRMNIQKTKQIQNLCEKYMRIDDIFFAQSENFLFFKWMNFERFLFDESKLNNVLIETQRWLNNNFRDIFNENDEILNVRFELIYIINTQRLIKFNSNRWIIIEHILKFVNRFAFRIV